MAVIKNTITPFLSTLPKKIDQAVKIAFEKWLNIVVSKMKDRVPVNTGALRNSIKWTKIGNEYSLEAGNESINYASFIEFGTFKMRANPFFYPTINELEPELINILNEELDKIR